MLIGSISKFISHLVILCDAQLMFFALVGHVLTIEKKVPHPLGGRGENTAERMW